MVTVALSVGQAISDHTVQAYVRGEPAPVVFDLSSHRGSWVVLIFYPGDFTFICPTELAAFARRHADFIREGAVLLAASTSSFFSHKAWFETDPRLAEVRYPVIADTLHELSRSFGVLLEDGAAHRGTFIVDPNGVLVHMSVTEHDVGRSVDEVLRVLGAFRTGALCPANWAPGDATLAIEDDWLGKGVPRPRRPGAPRARRASRKGVVRRRVTRSSPRATPRTASTSSREARSRSAAVPPRAT